MAKDPAFSFYAQDFIIDTVQWTRAAKGLHCELLAIAWINGYIEANHGGEPVELDADGLALWNSRVSKKWILKDGRLYNLKLEETREKRNQFKERQSVKGQLSAEKRKSLTNPGLTGVQPVSPVEPLESEYEKENTVLKDRKEPEEKLINHSFESFWDLYDKKVGDKGKLEKKWASLKDADREKIMQYIPEYKRAKPEKQYRKDPGTFFNNQSWNDELIFTNNATGTQPGITTNRKSAGATQLLGKLKSNMGAYGGGK